MGWWADWSHLWTIRTGLLLELAIWTWYFACDGFIRLFSIWPYQLSIKRIHTKCTSLVAIFVDEDDIGTYTIKAVDDPRTLNKILYMRPPNNSLSQNELISLWEKKTGKTFERVYVPEEEVVKKIQGICWSLFYFIFFSFSFCCYIVSLLFAESPFPLNIMLDVGYCAYVKGDHTGFEIDPSVGVEASQLYPDVEYTMVNELLNRFL